jgi:hypothetical protein
MAFRMNHFVSASGGLPDLDEASGPVRRGLSLILFGLAAAIPIYVISRFLALAFYAFPESDDYCFLFRYRTDGLFGLVDTFYHSLVGRVVPLILIAVPGMVTGGSARHFVASYAPTLLGFALLFAGCMAWITVRLWRGVPASRLIYLSLSLVATIWASCEDPRELLYWLPGTACYAVSAALVTIILTELYVSAADGTGLSRVQTGILAAFSFVAALCNEFTPVWLIGIVLGSFLFRRFSNHARPQPGAHLVLLIATLAGFAILLAAPANFVRIGQFPGSGKILGSLLEAAKRAPLDWTRAFVIAIPWSLAGSLCATPRRASPRSAANLMVLFAGLAVVLFGCAFLAHFIGYFATGRQLASRADNEVLILLVVGFACGLSGIGAFLNNLKLGTLGSAAICALLTVPILSGNAFELLRAETPLLDTFRTESLSREQALLSGAGTDLRVPGRTVRPRLLMDQDVGGAPDRLPNDCVAAAYNLKSVVLK